MIVGFFFTILQLSTLFNRIIFGKTCYMLRKLILKHPFCSFVTRWGSISACNKHFDYQTKNTGLPPVFGLCIYRGICVSKDGWRFSSKYLESDNEYHAPMQYLVLSGDHFLQSINFNNSEHLSLLTNGCIASRWINAFHEYLLYIPTSDVPKLLLGFHQNRQEYSEVLYTIFLTDALRKNSSPSSTSYENTDSNRYDLHRDEEKGHHFQEYEHMSPSEDTDVVDVLSIRNVSVEACVECDNEASCLCPKLFSTPLKQDNILTTEGDHDAKNFSAAGKKLFREEESVEMVGTSPRNYGRNSQDESTLTFPTKDSPMNFCISSAMQHEANVHERSVPGSVIYDDVLDIVAQGNEKELYGPSSTFVSEDVSPFGSSVNVEKDRRFEKKSEEFLGFSSMDVKVTDGLTSDRNLVVNVDASCDFYNDNSFSPRTRDLSSSFLSDSCSQSSFYTLKSPSSSLYGSAFSNISDETFQGSDNESNVSICFLPADDSNKLSSSDHTDSEVTDLDNSLDAQRNDQSFLCDDGPPDNDGLGGRETPFSDAPHGVSSESSNLHKAKGLKSNSSPKPPNVLIYTNDCNSTKHFDSFLPCVQACLSPDTYVCHNLQQDDVLKKPWMENAICLIIASPSIPKKLADVFIRYLKQGGSVLSIQCEAFDSLILKTISASVLNEQLETSLEIKFPSSNASYAYHLRSPLFPSSILKPLVWLKKNSEISECGKTNEQRIETFVREQEDSDLACLAIYVSGSVENNRLKKKSFQSVHCSLDITSIGSDQCNGCGFLCHLLEYVGLETVEVSQKVLPDIRNSPIYVLASTEDLRKSFLSLFDVTHLPVRVTVDAKGHFSRTLLSDNEDVTVTGGDLVLDLLSHTDTKRCIGKFFNFAEYRKFLKTNILGNVVFCVEVTESTMNLFFDKIRFRIPPNIGLVAIACRQFGGKGRGGNQWISPLGCSMFSVTLRILTDSPLGRHIAILQHLSALAIVQALLSISGCADLPLVIKWPNDILTKQGHKLGGILVTCSHIGNYVYPIIGCGVNVCNVKPTVSVNSLLEEFSGRKTLSSESVIAAILTRLEQLINIFQTTGGVEKVIEMYYMHWMHSNQRVFVEELHCEANVEGIDNNGFLLVRSSDGFVHTLVPDGNSFDIMRNLILMKK